MHKNTATRSFFKKNNLIQIIISWNVFEIGNSGVKNIILSSDVPSEVEK